MKFNLKIVSDMTPTAIKLYQYAASRPLPVAISISDFRQLCGLEDSVPGWQNEVERVCRELVSVNVFSKAYSYRLENKNKDGERIAVGG